MEGRREEEAIWDVWGAAAEGLGRYVCAKTSGAGLVGSARRGELRSKEDLNGLPPIGRVEGEGRPCGSSKRSLTALGGGSKYSSRSPARGGDWVGLTAPPKREDSPEVVGDPRVSVPRVAVPAFADACLNPAGPTYVLDAVPDGLSSYSSIMLPGILPETWGDRTFGDPEPPFAGDGA